MKKSLILLLTLPSLTAFAGESKITVDSITPTKVHGVYFVKNIQIKNGDESFRIKFNQTNKKRICRELGFSEAAGSRSEFSKDVTVVNVNSDLEITRVAKPETNYIENLNCIQ